MKGHACTRQTNWKGSSVEGLVFLLAVNTRGVQESGAVIWGCDGRSPPTLEEWQDNEAGSVALGTGRYSVGLGLKS